MHRMKIGTLALLAGVVALVVVIGVVPFFGGTGSADDTWTGARLSVDNTASTNEFIIPAVPVNTVGDKLSASAQPPVPLTLGSPRTSFPEATIASPLQLLLGKTELVTYHTEDGPCGTLGPNQVCIVARGPEKNPPAPKKDNQPGASVQLATQLVSPIPGTAGECDLGGSGIVITATEVMTAAAPRLIDCVGTASMGKTGSLSISHTSTQTPNKLTDVPNGTEQGTEFFQYSKNTVGTCTPGADQLCLTDRAQQSDNENRVHRAGGYAQPCSDDDPLIDNWGSCPAAGETRVTEHFNITVKSNVGFFPSKPMLIYDVDEDNNPIEQELFGYDNGAVKVKDMTSNTTQFHITSRGNAAVAFKTNTAVVEHLAGSIVTGAHTILVCRAGLQQPMLNNIEPATQNPVGSSVAAYPVCYTTTQPNASPKDIGVKKLNVPVIGSTLIVLSAAQVPFLSTGGITTVNGDVPHVDTNGTSDGVLNLSSPCMLDFTPGVNMLVTIVLNVDDLHLTQDIGTISVVQDTSHDDNETGNSADDCDDPAGTSSITFTTYTYPNPGKPSEVADDPADNDTDGDGCIDRKELFPLGGSGGLRDPWNPHDWFDPDGGGVININDIFDVAGLFPSVAPTAPYDVARDRDTAYGPMGWNLSQPNGVINISDIFYVAAGFPAAC